MFSLLPWERTLVAASHVPPTVVLPQGPQEWGSAYTLFPNRSAEMTDGSEKRKHQLTFELQSSLVFKNPTPMRSPLSQKVTWPAATRVLSRGKREPWERDYRRIKFLRRSRCATAKETQQVWNEKWLWSLSDLFVICLFVRRCTAFNDIPIILLFLFVCCCCCCCFTTLH